MILVLASWCAVMVMAACQGTAVRVGIDPVTPLLTALALAAPRTRGIAWIVPMALVWSAFSGVPWTAVLCLWSVTFFVVRSIARRVEWERNDISFAIAVFTSIGWRTAVLAFVFLAGRTPSLSWRTWLTLVTAGLSSGVIFAVFFSFIMQAAAPVWYYRRQHAKLF